MQPRFLSPDEQHAVIEYLTFGASALAALRKIERDYADFEHTRRHDPAFRRRCVLAQQAVAGNVESALYKQAMDGSVSAQTNWLRLCRDRGDAASADTGETDDDGSLDKLIRIANDYGISIPPELAPADPSRGGEKTPPGLPANADAGPPLGMGGNLASVGFR